MIKIRSGLLSVTKLGGGLGGSYGGIMRMVGIAGRYSGLSWRNYNFLNSHLSTWRNLLLRRPTRPPTPPSPQPHDTLHFGQFRTDPYRHLDLKEGGIGVSYLESEREYYSKKLKEWGREFGEGKLKWELGKVVEVAGEVGDRGDRIVEVKGEGVTIYGNELGYYYYPPPPPTVTSNPKIKFTRYRKEYLLLFKELSKLGELDGSLEGEDCGTWEVVKFQVTDDMRYLTLQLRGPASEAGPLLLLDRRPPPPFNSHPPPPYLTLGHHQCQLLHLASETFNSLLYQDRYLFYTVMGDKLRPEVVKFYQFGEGGEEGRVKVVFREEGRGEGQFLDIGVTRDQKYLTVNCNTLTTSTVYLHHPDWSHPRLFHPSRDGVECFLDHLEDRFLLLSNHNHHRDGDQPGPRRSHRLYSVEDSQLQPHLTSTSPPSGTPFDWTALAREVDLKLDFTTTTLTDVELFKDYALLYGSDDQGLPLLKVHHWATGSTTSITRGIPTVATLQPAGITQSYTSQTGWILVTSPLHPPTTLPLRLDRAQLGGTLRPIEPRQLAHISTTSPSHPSSAAATPASYHVTREWVPAAGPDHPAIPLTYITGFPRQPDQPILMVAYGAYGVNLTPDFRPHYFPLLTRGWAVALVHVRGGSELGPEWYQAGSNFPCRIDDFHRAAQYLHDLSPTGRILAASGTSAGAVTVAGAVHRQPALFRALTLHAPFLDPLTAMLDPHLPLTSPEYLEWGNPTRDPTIYHRLRTHSPYDTLPTPTSTTPAHALPPLLLTVGARDRRVDPLVTLKYLARYRSLTHPLTPLLLDWSTTAGHRPHSYHHHHRSKVDELQFLLSVTRPLPN